MKREKTESISGRHLISAVAGTIVTMAPANKPRKLDIIIEKLQNIMKENCLKQCVNDRYKRVVVTAGTVGDTIETWLKSIDEFMELNKSNNEINGKGKTKTCFVGLGIPEPHPDNDFIDIDACIRNIIDAYYALEFYEADCEFCIHKDKDSELCNTCVREKSDNYQARVSICDKYDYRCGDKFDCKEKGYYICCKVCGSRDKCSNPCTCEPETCGVSIQKKDIDPNLRY